MQRTSLLTVLLILTAACAPPRVPVVFDLRRATEPELTSTESTAANDLEYTPVSTASAAILGCDATPSSPVCNVASPSAEEDSAFQAEGVRLTFHADARCRKLGAAIMASESGVMMYRKAVVRWSRGQTMYGVGHAYELGDAWMVRIARSIDDLNERTLEEKTRTLRHEMSHTIGATESSALGWSAEDYASRCA